MSDQQIEKYFKIAVGSLLILFFGFLANPLHGSGSAKLGGTFINSDSASVNGSLDYQWEMDKWQQTLETDYVYKEEDNEEILNEFVFNTKSNFTFAPKQYVFGIVGYDYDKFRADGDRKVLGIGYGYKLLRTERIKASNEFSLATLQTDSINEMIYRNSLWFSFKIVDRVTFTNKFLYEEGSDSDVYIRNETALNYTFDNGILFGLSNTYTEDPIDTNVLSFNVGVKW
tara:strand:+ start:1080 stop:1763 length:684 start_codon:yes stop_codon:yes gene_type:complete